MVQKGVGNIAKAASDFAAGVIDWQQEKLKEDGAVIYAKKMADLRQAAAEDATVAEEKLKVVDDNGVYNVLVQTDDQDPHNGKPVSQWLSSRFQDRANGVLNGVQNQYARQHLEHAIPTYASEVASSAVHMEARARREARIEGLGQTIEMTANQVRANPALLEAALRDTQTAITGAKIGGVKEQSTLDAAQSALGYAALSGIVEKDWRVARTILTDEKDPRFQQFNSLLKPNQKDHLLNLVDQQQRIEKANLRSEVNQTVHDHFASVAEFGTGVPGLRERYHQAYADEPHMIAAFDRKEQIARVGYQVTQKIKTAPIGEIPALIEGLMPTTGGIGVAERLQVAAHVQAEAERHIRALATDPAGAVQMLFKDNLAKISDPSERLAHTLELQRMKGVPAPQVFSKAQVAQYVQDIQAAKPEQAIASIASILGQTQVKNKNGTLRDIVVQTSSDQVTARDLAFEQLQSAHNGLPPTYLALVGAIEDNDLKLAHDLSKVLARRKDGLYSMLPDKEADLKTIRLELQTSLADWKTGAAMGGVERAEAIKAVMTAAEELALSKTFDGLSPVDAAKAAAQQLVIDKYALIRGGLQIPKRLPGIDGEVNAKRVLSGLAKERERLSTDFAARQALAFTIKGAPRWAGKDLKELVHDTALQNGRWVNNNSNTAAMYQITLRDGSNLFLRNPDGSMYEVPFSRANEIGTMSITPVASKSERTAKALSFEQSELRRYDQLSPSGRKRAEEGGWGTVLFMENDGTTRRGRVKIFEDGTRRILPAETK
jgi:hypothetical protein